MVYVFWVKRYKLESSFHIKTNRGKALLLTFAKNPFSKFNVSISQNILLKEGRKSNKYKFAKNQEYLHLYSLRVWGDQPPFLKAPLLGNKCSLPLFRFKFSFFPMLILIYLYMCLRQYNNNFWTEPTLAHPSLYNWTRNTSFVQTHPQSQTKFPSQIWESVFLFLAII